MAKSLIKYGIILGLTIVSIAAKFNNQSEQKINPYKMGTTNNAIFPQGDQGPKVYFWGRVPFCRRSRS